MANRFLLGMEALTHALRALDEREPKAGGYHVRLFADGSGCLVEEDSGPERDRFHFQTPAELWAWLYADVETRSQMEREYYVREQISTPEEVETFLRAAVKPTVQ